MDEELWNAIKEYIDAKVKEDDSIQDAILLSRIEREIIRRIRGNTEE